MGENIRVGADAGAKDDRWLLNAAERIKHLRDPIFAARDVGVQQHQVNMGSFLVQHRNDLEWLVKFTCQAGAPVTPRARPSNFGRMGRLPQWRSGIQFSA